MKTNLDPFTAAYLRTALWSSTEYQFGQCPCCGEQRLLSRYPEAGNGDTPLWCAECGEGEPNPPPMDKNYTLNDLAPETLARMVADCAQFQEKHAETLREAIASGHVKHGPDFDEDGRAGHDFWLTRCAMGAGFWDGGWPEPQATVLTDAAHTFGECSLYAGDDGKLYLL